MDQTEIDAFQFLTFGILGMFGLALAIVFFAVFYQRKLLGQKLKHEQARLEYQQELLKAVLDAQEEERVRIGRDLHDDIGSMIATARLYVQQSQVQSPNPELANWVDKADNMLIDTANNLRKIAQDLVPTVLDQLGLEEAIGALCDVVRQSSHLSITFKVTEIPQIPKKIALNLYRITQELFSNVLKHAEANSVDIYLCYKEENIELTFKDDGKGIPLLQNVQNKGLGLKNIESRLSLLDGKLSIEAQANPGAQFIIYVPYVS